MKHDVVDLFQRSDSEVCETGCVICGRINKTHARQRHEAVILFIYFPQTEVLAAGSAAHNVPAAQYANSGEQTMLFSLCLGIFTVSFALSTK